MICAQSRYGPVVLIGALNGAGKTTLLEGIQLALYGRSARYLVRGAKGYEEYLRSLINRHVNPRDGASVTLDFTHRSGGKASTFSVRRTWSSAGNRIKETIEVDRDGLPDPVVAERWVEFINDVLPVQIADLFLFDGERIEALADHEKSADVLRTGVHALLGLDLVDNLDRSLVVLERRLEKEVATPEQQVHIAELEQSLTELRGVREALVSREATLQNQIDEATKTLARAEDRLRSEGGDLAVGRDALLAEATKCQHVVEEVENDLRDLAALGAPLMLVSELVEDARILSSLAANSARDTQLAAHLASNTVRIKASLKDAGFNAKQASAVLKCVKDSVFGGRTSGVVDPWLDVLGALSDQVFEEAVEETALSVTDMLARHEEAIELLARAEANVAAVPAPETISALIEDVVRAEEQLIAFSAERSAATAERDSVERTIGREAEKLDGLYGKRRETDRVTYHAGRARQVLGVFRRQVAARKLQALEQRIIANYRTLLHKDDLVSGVRIDPISYELTLTGDGGEILQANRLSAGERQLMATAILWSLAQASGRELPIVIDTPLGRLDGSHRHLLVENYFPKASHQVILLSTDEEVRERYYRVLEPHISRRYLITHSGIDRTSTFREGYFDFGVAA